MDNVRIRSDTRAVTIGNNVVINCSRVGIDQDSSINSCDIGDNVFVGVGAYIGEGAKIEAGAMIAAGAIVPNGAVVKSGQVWAGNPAKFLRELTAIERENLKDQHKEYFRLSEVHAEHTELTFREFLDQVDYRAIMPVLPMIDQLYMILSEKKYGTEEDESQYSFVRESTDEETQIKPYDFSAGYYEPYQHDYSKYPDCRLV